MNLAPNEKESNLTPEQYKLVRNPDIRYEDGGKVKSDYIKRVKEAIKYVENSPKARMQIDFEDEEGAKQSINEGKDYERIFPLKSKSNSFIVKKIREGVQDKYHSYGIWNEKKKSYDYKYPKNEKYGDKSKEYDTLQIATYDDRGKIVGTIKIATSENKKEDVKKGAFKISVRNDYQNKGIASKLIEKAESEGVDFIEALKNNNFTSKGRWYFISWLNKKLKNKVTYADGGNVENKEVYKKWKSLVNMSKSELENFYNSQEGKDAGLSSKEASEQGISSGRESARWIMKMKETPMQDWTPTMWNWAKKQISFISRMSGNRGDLYDEKGNKTRKHTSLLIWGNNPKKYEQGANIENETNKNKMDKTIEISTSEYKFSEFYEWFKNYVPASLYNEEWVSEMRTLNNLIKDNNVEEKVTFTDDRLVLISNFALCYSDVIKGGLREWWIVRRYLQQYTDNNSIQGTDLLEFVDKYIGYTYTDATLKDESLSRVETLKSVLSKYVKDDSIMIPYFVKNEIMSGAKEEAKEIIVRKEAPKKENVDLPEEEKWQGLKDFAEMMMEDAEGEALEKWEGLYEFCELMLEK